MSTNYSPKIITDGLVLHLDAANNKSVPKNNIIGTWTDFNSQQAYYDVTGPYSITLKTGNSNWVGYYPATIPSGGQYVFTFKYYQTGSIGSLTVDNDGANDNAYNATLYPSLGEEKTFTKVVDVSATGLTQFFLRRNSGGDIYIYDVSYFKLETTCTDLSGNGYTGTFNNGPTYDSNNLGSIVFDGVNDYIDLNTNNIIAGRNPFTFEAFYKVTNASVAAEIFGNYGSGYSTNTIWISGRYGVYINGLVPYFQGYPLGAGTYHMGFTRNSAGNCVLYKNGVVDGTATSTSSIAIGQNFRIGSDVNGIAEVFGGNLYNLKVYNRVLSSSEIQQNFNALRGRFGV